MIDTELSSDWKEPLWWGRGSSVCLGIDKFGPYYKLFTGNDKTGQRNESMLLLPVEVISLGEFLIDVAKGREFKNG